MVSRQCRPISRDLKVALTPCTEVCGRSGRLPIPTRSPARQHIRIRLGQRPREDPARVLNAPRLGCKPASQSCSTSPIDVPS